MIFIIILQTGALDGRKLRVLELNNLGSVAFIHHDLSLTQGLVLCIISLILVLQEGHLLSQLLHLACRLSLDILGDFLILSLAKALQGLILVLQLLVLIA